MMYHYGHGWGMGGGLLVALVVVLIAGAVTAAVIAMTRMVGPWPRVADRPIQEDVERILADRYARGELDSEEYERRLYTLRTTRPRP